jgi:uncharacterized membrane protein YphA (DoxX/SURF4 family)
VEASALDREDEHKLSGIWIVLRFVFGFIPLVAGVDKFVNLLVDWPRYLSPILAGHLPVPVATLMKAVGVVEVLAGVLVLSPRTRLGAYFVMAWLLLVSLNLLLAGRYDIVVRDLGLAAGAFALARLTEVVAPASVHGWRRIHAPA